LLAAAPVTFFADAGLAGCSATGPDIAWITRPAEPADIAAAIASEIGRHVDYRPVAADGAARAAALLADLL
jgi:hypothetical protein